MSDTDYLLAQCQSWYGEENGLRMYNRHRDTMHRIFMNPTEIKAHPPRLCQYSYQKGYVDGANQ